jgi:hypothetical protein
VISARESHQGCEIAGKILVDSSLVPTFLRCPAYESHAHEVHAHEAYAPKTDEHCAVFTIRHLLPHRSTLSTGLPPHEHLLPPTRTYCLLRVPCCLPRIPCYLLREHAVYTHLLDFAACSKYLSQRILWGIGSRSTDSKLGMESCKRANR